MVKVLVRFYNVMIKFNHFLSRWLDVLIVTIEKRKGYRINELRVVQIIEADLQLLMRMLLGLIIACNYENDSRISKHNYGSRK